MENIVIRDSILTNELTFQGYKPHADTWENGTVSVQTYSHMLYDLDPLDFNNHLSARCEEGGINIKQDHYLYLQDSQGQDETGRLYLRECARSGRQR